MTAPRLSLDELEALAWAETQRGRACHIDGGAPDRDVLRAGSRILAWAPKVVTA